ncbi:class I SAM-dependent methyltransferase [Cytobacillus oceanisediminis]|uniref:class I SAM-dependent methyltransferase n=1 Tax=Cytobacillus oceanisediminis TaxID=665099 RepID=UPI0024948170|nr:class I SAM-dependent methyltransferase [Cytobacillus oceanisediminis]
MIAYYGELCTKMYESDKSMAEGPELSFYLSYAKGRKMKVLEPMCGNGRMLIPFIQHGVDTDGFDISEDMLKVCKEKARKLNLKPNVFQKKIEEFNSAKKYDLIMIPYGSFSLLPDSLVNISLQNLKNALNEGGKMLLAIVEKDNEVEEAAEWTETNRKELEGQTIIENRKIAYDDETKILHIQLKYDAVGEGTAERTELMDFPIRLYDPCEFNRVLKDNGFRQIAVHEVRDGYGDGQSFPVYECTK